MTYFHRDTVLSPLQNKSLPRRITVLKTPGLKHLSAREAHAAALGPAASLQAQLLSGAEAREWRGTVGLG